MKLRFQIIAALEVIGGGVGVLFLIWWFLATPFNAYSLILAPIPLGIYILSLVAGVSLWRGRALGRTLSIIVQAIQLPKIISPQIIFIFSFGVDVWVQFLFSGEATKLGFEFRFLAFNQFFFNVPDAPVGLGISIPACAFLIMLLEHKKQPLVTEVAPPPPPPTEWNEDSLTDEL